MADWKLWASLVGHVITIAALIVTYLRTKASITESATEQRKTNLSQRLHELALEATVTALVTTENARQDAIEHIALLSIPATSQKQHDSFEEIKKEHIGRRKDHWSQFLRSLVFLPPAFDDVALQLNKALRDFMFGPGNNEQKLYAAEETLAEAMKKFSDKASEWRTELWQTVLL